jgi:hypothetical protein
MPDRSPQRFDFLAFFFFLEAFLADFLTAFLADFFAEDFFAEDFLEAFLAFLDFFAAFFGAAFLAAFFAVFLAFFLRAGLAAGIGGSAAGIVSVIGSRAGFSSSISYPPWFIEATTIAGFVRVLKRGLRDHAARTFCIGLERAFAADPVIDDRRRLPSTQAGKRSMAAGSGLPAGRQFWAVSSTLGLLIASAVKLAS